MKLVTEILGDPQIETGREAIALLGIGQPSEVTLEYCRALMIEYGALDSAQLFTLLKKYGHIPDKQRLQIGKVLCQEHYAKRISFEGRTGVHTLSGTPKFKSRGGFGSRSVVFGCCSIIWTGLTGTMLPERPAA